MTGKYVGCTTMDNDHSVHVWDSKKGGRTIASEKGGDCPFFDMAFSTKDEETFVTIGKRPK